MISKEKLQFLAQLIQAMDDSAIELEKAIAQNDIERIRKIKEFLLGLQQRINEFSLSVDNFQN